MPDTPQGPDTRHGPDSREGVGRRLEVAHPPVLSGPSYHPVTELVRALEAAGVPRTRAPFARGVPSLRSRAAERLGVNRAVVRHPSRAVLVPVMGPNPGWLFPYSATRECVLFCWDVWPPDAALWARLLRRHRVRFAVMTARASALHWRASVPGLRTAWIPEAADPLPGAPGPPLAARRVRVLELGRRHAAYHAAVTPRLARAGVPHRYEQPPGSVVFPTRDDLASGLLDTVVSVCFPSSVTHPRRSGDVATLTRRYLES
ncbi:MAG TPA: hypothetical protein VF755_00565, partial [Catenuloplanes sp.]